MATDANVDLRRRESVATAEPQEVLLQVATGAILPALPVDWQAKHVRLADCSSQFIWAKGAGPALRRCPAQVEDRARRSRDRYPPEKRHIGRDEREGAMHADTGTFRPAAITPDGDVVWMIGSRQEPPEEGGAAMADSRSPIVEDEIAIFTTGSTTDRKNGGQELALRRERGVTHRVNAPMHPMQVPCVDAPSHSALAETQAVQLPHRYDSVLAARDLRNRDVRPGDFSSHTGG